MLSASIVLYHNDPAILAQAVNSFLNIPLKKHLYLIDNSQSDELGELFKSDEVTYIHTNENLGFGKAHNFIIPNLGEESKYHLILNPDAYFEKETVPTLIDHIEKEGAIGIIAPKIVYPDGSLQASVRKFPKPHDLLLRRIPGLKKVFKKAYKRGNYMHRTITEPLEVDAVSGCFQIFRTDVFIKIEGFDDRFFMYMEDLDICKKVWNAGYKVVYFPDVFVYHHSAYGSKKEVKLLKAHLKSMWKYYAKWYF